MQRMLTKLFTSLMLIGLFLFIPINVNAETIDIPEDYQTYLEAVCETYNICPEFVEALIWYESGWKPDVKVGSFVGLGMVHEGYAKERMKRLGVTDLNNAYQNMIVTVDLLTEFFDEYEDPAKVLDRYNGQLHSDAWYEQGNMTRYSKKILELSEELEREHGK